ncbi:MAG: glycerophosphodiester phosphodiesterase [Anaerolineae bacterium]|nr:glycerophosphodiester phosphodiesterase [Anaerolineae bacterium]
MWRRIFTVFAVFIIIAIAVYVFFVLAVPPMPEHPFFARGENDTVLVIAHQGGDGLRPSNTMASFEHAMELGVDVLEMDIHSTSDGVLVTIHDDTVDRTTDGTGRVQDMTFEELQQLDAGYNWPTLQEAQAEIEGHPYRGEGITIPSLEEIFQAFPDMRMNIEIKQELPSIVQPFCDLLREYEMTDQVLVASFHESTMQEFRAACPEVPTSGVESEITVFYALNVVGLAGAYLPSAYAFQVPEYSGDLHVVTSRFVRAAAEHNIEVHPWTINTRDDMERILETGAQGIITDYPDVLLDVLGR